MLTRILKAVAIAWDQAPQRGKRQKTGWNSKKKKKWAMDWGAWKGQWKVEKVRWVEKHVIEKQLVVKLLTWSLPSFAAQPSEVMLRTIRPSSLGNNFKNNGNLNKHWRNWTVKSAYQTIGTPAPVTNLVEKYHCKVNVTLFSLVKYWKEKNCMRKY